MSLRTVVHTIPLFWYRSQQNLFHSRL